VAVQELVNNATTLNFNALLVADEQQAQHIVPQLLAFNRAVPEKVMVFSLADRYSCPVFRPFRRLSIRWTPWRRASSAG
jgi:hypothetical protein